MGGVSTEAGRIGTRMLVEEARKCIYQEFVVIVSKERLDV